MSIINCSEYDCVYQKEGKCEFNNVVSGFMCTTKPCIHYVSAKHSPNSDISGSDIQTPHLS